LGLSDATLIEDYLSGLRGVRYKNTFFDVRPRLDITNPSIFLRGSADILISSDVLEHVFFPVSKALDGHSTVLKRGGLLILTVPYTTQFENSRADDGLFADLKKTADFAIS
jgi:hypothetical protein